VMTDRIETVLDRAARSYIEYFGRQWDEDARNFTYNALERFPKLLPETKMQWVKSLRSGKFRQGRRYLFDIQTGYCCLGVYGTCLGISIDDMILNPLLPHDVFAKTLVDPLSYHEDGTQCAFSLFNDVYKLSFYDIATIIEEYC
jgi:hypothetical protein